MPKAALNGVYVVAQPHHEHGDYQPKAKIKKEALRSNTLRLGV